MDVWRERNEAKLNSSLAKRERVMKTSKKEEHPQNVGVVPVFSNRKAPVTFSAPVILGDFSRQEPLGNCLPDNIPGDTS